jgi:hypothetical protein
VDLPNRRPIAERISCATASSKIRSYKLEDRARLKNSQSSKRRIAGSLKPDDRPLAFGLGARHFHQRFAVEHDLAVDRANAGEPRAGFFGDQLGDRDRDHDGVAYFHRRAKIERLRDVDGARAGQAGAEHGRDQARGIEPVRNTGAERGLPIASTVPGLTPNSSAIFRTPLSAAWLRVGWVDLARHLLRYAR